MTEKNLRGEAPPLLETLAENEKYQEFIEANREAEEIWANMQRVFDEHEDDLPKAEGIVLKEYADAYDEAIKRYSEAWEAWHNAMEKAHEAESVAGE